MFFRTSVHPSTAGTDFIYAALSYDMEMQPNDKVLVYLVPVIVRGVIDRISPDHAEPMLTIRRTDGVYGCVSVSPKVVYPDTIAGRRDLARVIEDDAAQMQRISDALIDENIRATKGMAHCAAAP